MSAALRSAQPAYDAVVRPLSRVAQRPCARPGCPSPARATLNFAYERREAWLDALSDRQDPQAYDLCSAHAGRTRPPHGWRMRDRRPDEERIPTSPPVTPTDLGSEHTVAVLAAALRAIPPSAPENGPRRVTEVMSRHAGEAAPGGRPDIRPSTAAAPLGIRPAARTEAASFGVDARNVDDDGSPRSVAYKPDADVMGSDAFDVDTLRQHDVDATPLMPRRLASRPTLTFRHHATTIDAVARQPAGKRAHTLNGCAFATSW